MKSSWNSLIEYYFGDISVNMNYQSSDDIIYPPNDIVFKCFDYFDISQTRVVIIGQDPYHQTGQATGLAFGVNTGITIPPSLRNIKKELMNDLGIELKDITLESWAKQGVLLLNSSLTVIKGKPGSQIKLWKDFTDFIIQKISLLCKDVIFVAWGAFAYDKIMRNLQFDESLPNCINNDLIIISSHPSPLSNFKKMGKYSSFSGSKPFSKINYLLEKYNYKSINW